MKEPAPLPEAVVRFLRAEIFSVPQLEVLLLVHGSAGAPRTAGDLAQEFYLPASAFEPWLAAFVARGLLTSDDRGYAALPPDAPHAALLTEVADSYARRRVTVTRQVYATKEDPASRFADAFRLRKDKKP